VVVRRNRPVGLTAEEGMAVGDGDVMRRLRIRVEEVRWWWQKRQSLFFFFCSLLFWRCMVERDEQTEREKQQQREKERDCMFVLFNWLKLRSNKISCGSNHHT
jgi:hypothetical protein